VELIFKALGDRHRRLLLDRLLERDGQTLGELDAALPGMTRFGVMKHLGVLQTANLITVRRVGRRKLHYLNAAPIQLVLERWFGKYARATAGARPTTAPESRAVFESGRAIQDATRNHGAGERSELARPREQRVKL